MAGEIGHVVYAARLLRHLEGKIHDSQYWVGTLFPDIRHLGVVSRHRTHPEHVTLQSLIGKDDFHTGMRVHAWIDATREKYLRDSNIKESLPWHPFVPHALKLAEDVLLYDKFDEWDRVSKILHTIHDDELFYIEERERIVQWHTILQDYFRNPPDDASRMQLSTSIGLSESSAQEMNTVVQQLLNDKRTEQMLNGFIDRFEQLLR